MLMVFSFCITQQKLHSGWNLVCCVTWEFRLEKQLLVHIDYKFI